MHVLALRKSLFTLLIALLLLTSAALSAQDVELSESMTVTAGDLELSVAYPEDWVADSDSTGAIIYLATSDDALEIAISGGNDFDRGDVAITVISPAGLETVGIDSTGDAEEVLSNTLEALAPQLDVQIVPFNAFGVPGAISQVFSESPRIDVLLVAFEFEDGVVVAGVQPSDPQSSGSSAEIQEIVEAIMRSVSLIPEGAQVETSELGERLTVDVELPTGTVEFSIALPVGWVHEYFADPGALYMAASRDALALVTGQVDPDAEFSEGEVAISIAMPGVLGMMDLGIDADPADAVNAFAEFVGGELQSDMQTAEAAQGVPVQIAPVAGDGLPGGTAVIAGAAFDAGTILVVVTPVTAFDDSIVTILDSIRFGEQGAPVEVVESEKTDEIRQWASGADGSSQYGTSSWSFAQATDAPDTDTCGDHTTAWAAAGSTTSETLRLSFDTPVIPTEVNIYQTFNPGAIIQIDVASSDDPERVLPIDDSADPPGNTKCPGVFSLDLSHVDEPVDMVVIYLDQKLTGSWNEIDAVELVGVPAE